MDGDARFALAEHHCALCQRLTRGGGHNPSRFSVRAHHGQSFVEFLAQRGGGRQDADVQAGAL